MRQTLSTAPWLSKQCCHYIRRHFTYFQRRPTTRFNVVAGWWVVGQRVLCCFGALNYSTVTKIICTNLLHTLCTLPKDSRYYYHHHSHHHHHHHHHHNHHRLLYTGYLYLYSWIKLCPWGIQCCSYSVVTIHGAYIVSSSVESIVLLH